ncbi:MAG: T9SS type A sorting domain-containing protein [Chitinophagales bacterium]|nr:T9SS type A sorting domain-containing protein [Chitinophagales bacterium]
MIFIEGSLGASDDFDAFYGMHLTYFEDFVSDGGHLYINFVSTPSYTYYLGFDSINRIENLSPNYEGIYIGEDISFLVGPKYPLTNPIDFSPDLGFVKSFGDFNGDNYDTLMIDTTGSRVCLLNKFFGLGEVIVSQFYNNIEHYSEEHLDLRRNILWHLAPCLHSETDLGIQDIIYPIAECNLGEENLQLLVHNYGFADQNNYTINFQVDGGIIMSEIITENIEAYLSDTILLSTTVDLSACGDHEIKLWTSVEGDTITNNDTLIFTITSICATPADLNYPITLCETDASFTPDINVGSGGIFSGEGITDTLTGTFDPGVYVNGTYALINYSYSTAMDYTMETIPYTPPEFISPTFVSFTTNDDVDTIGIGFNFNFYENTYDTIFPTSNGYMCFGEAHDTWYIGIPSPTINNLIALAGEDLNILGGGEVYYETSGSAPYRKFVIKYDEVHMNFPSYFYITVTSVLYESTGIIELYIDTLADLEEGAFTQGIVNDFGTKWINTHNPSDNEFVQKSWHDGANDTAFRFIPVFCSAVAIDTIFIGPQLIVTSTPAIGGENNGTATATITNGGTPPFSFLWETGETTATIENLSPGFYTTTVTDSLECSTTDSVEVTFANSLEDISENSIKLYPNPSETFFILEVGNDFLNASIELINVEGKIMYSENLTTNTSEIKVGDFLKGIYYLKIRSDKNNYYQAIIIN